MKVLALHDVRVTLMETTPRAGGDQAEATTEQASNADQNPSTGMPEAALRRGPAGFTPSKPKLV